MQTSLLLLLMKLFQAPILSLQLKTNHTKVLYQKRINFTDVLYNYVASSVINYNTLYSIAAGISISSPLAHQISPLALYQIPPSSSRPGSPKASRKPTPSSHLNIDPSSTGNNLVRPVIHLIGRNSAPGSRRGSGNSLYGSGSLIGNTSCVYL